MNGRHANPDEDVELPKQKTAIICTLGPVSRSVDVLEQMLLAGMRVARFNFSHGSHEYHQETLDALRQACDNTGIFCAVLLDTKGPEIRTGMLENGEPVLLEKDQKLAAEEPGVCFVGRLASYKYFNMDQAFLNALETFDEVKGKGILKRTELGEGDGPK